MIFEKRVKELISYPTEREWFEFKENWHDAKGVGEYISSLANAAALFGEKYGYLVWGVEDKSHSIVGTDFNYNISIKNEPFQHFLARQLFPDNNFSFNEVVVDGKRVVVLQVPAAQKVPVSFDGVRYMRIGSSKVNLARHPDREAGLFRVLNEGLPSLNNTVSEYQDLSFDKLFVYYASKGIMLNRRNFKKNLGLLTADGKYNMLAQLLSDNSHITLRFAVFSGETKASIMYSVREFGNTCLLFSLDKVLEYGEIINVPQADERDRTVERKEIPLFDMAAFREAVINAFVHNSWISGNAPMITAFSNRIEILSRGTLPPGQTTEGFFAGESVPVNQKLSDIFLQLHISERTGRGVPKITETYGKEIYEFRDSSIVVNIPFDKLASGTIIPPGALLGKENIQNDKNRTQDEKIRTQDDNKNAPDEGKNAPDGSKNAPDKSKNAPDDGKNAPDGSKNAPDKSENVPDGGKNAPDKSNNMQNGSMQMPNRVRGRIEIEARILQLCRKPKGILEICDELGFKDKRTGRKYLNPLLIQGRIAMTLPHKPNSKNQKYITVE